MSRGGLDDVADGGETTLHGRVRPIVIDVDVPLVEDYVHHPEPSWHPCDNGSVLHPWKMATHQPEVDSLVLSRARRAWQQPDGATLPSPLRRDRLGRHGPPTS